jgi:vancomycin resistance protein YoaR
VTYHSYGRSSLLVRSRARRRQAGRRVLRVVALTGIVLAAVVTAVGFAYAGSPDRLAAGLRVAGFDVGGMTVPEARRLLEARAARLANVPVRFVADGRRFGVTPRQLGVRVDWTEALAAARDQGVGFGPLRGLRRLGVRIFGDDVAPSATYSGAAAAALVADLGRRVDQPAREPAVRLVGMRPQLVPGRTGLVLDRPAATRRMLAALASFSRETVTLPVRSDEPRVPDAALEPVLAQVRTALSAPVRLTLGSRRWQLQPWLTASLLRLPSEGRRTLEIGGPGADSYLRFLSRQIDRPASDARFVVSGATDSIRLQPSTTGLTLDKGRTEAAILHAALAPAGRRAVIRVAEAQPKTSTEDLEKLGITGLVGSYETVFSGIPNRIHNVELVSHLIDGKLIAPGAVFSFNGTTGERSAAKGFLEAPVIINGELQTGLGGGVCQVSTTVFNAAFEAGLPILERTNHALYISHYPLGRDATVDYPDVDLKFRNDTDHWLLLRAFVTSSTLKVLLFGAPQHRRVESTATPLRTTGPLPVKRIKDPTLPKGEKVIENSGTPPLATSVHRLVYAPSGKLLYDDTWYSSYRADPRIIRVGTKPKPAGKKGKNTTGKTTTGTAATTTAPATGATAPTATTTTPQTLPTTTEATTVTVG